MDSARILRYTVAFGILAAARPLHAQQSAWTVETSLRVKGVSAPVISPDGSLAAVVVSEPNLAGDTSAYRLTLHVRELARGPEGASIGRLTSASAPAWSPDGRWLAFATNRSGSRNVWISPARGGPSKQITQVQEGVIEFRWSPDSKSIAYTSTDAPSQAMRRAQQQKRDVQVVGEDLRFTRLWVTAVDSLREARLLTTKPYQVSGHIGAGLEGPSFSWSPDSRSIAFTHSPSPLADDWVNADVSIVDVATGRTRPLLNSNAAEGGVSWSPDGQWIAVAVSEVPASYALDTRMHIVSPTTGEVRALSESFDQRPGLIGWSADSRRVLVTEVRGVRNRLSALPIDGGAMLDLSPDSLLLAGAMLGANNTMIGFTYETPAHPAEAYVARIDDFVPTRITAVQPADLPASPRSEAVRWTSFDGHEVEGLLTYPIGWREGTRVPLLVIVHGGPPSAFTNGYTGRLASYPINVFAQRGFAVLRPNVRGSAGYGRDFRFANERDWGGGDTKDVLAGVDALVARGIADSARVGLMGWSYGGYLTAITITRTTRFRAASVGAGITDLVSFSGTADIPGFVPSYYGKEFWQDFEAYARGSAMYNVANVTTPTLIQHGERDERVPIGQGYQLYNALKRRGVPVRMLVYPRQGHGISEPALQVEAAQANVAWFEKWLK